MMNVSIEEMSSVKRKVTVELPAEEADRARSKHLQNAVRQSRLKGFRPGKAPVSLVAKTYADEIKAQTINDLVEDALPKALDEHKLMPVGLPMLSDVDYAEGQPFKFSVVVEIPPVFDTPEWHGLALKKLKGGVTGEDVERKVGELRLGLATVKKVEEDRPLAKGDIANLSYQGYDGDQPINNMKLGPLNVEIGTDRVTAEFEEGLTGMKAGETKDIHVTMPEDLPEKKMAGKHVALRTTVHEIRQRELPAVDDEFAKDLGLEGVETMEALRDRIRRELEREREYAADREFNKQLTTLLAGLVKIEVPTAMVDREVSARVETLRKNLEKNGLDFKKMGFEMRQLKERFRPEAEEAVTASLVLEQIGRDAGVEVTEDDLEAEYKRISEDYRQPVATVREFYKSKTTDLPHALKVSKTLKMIRDAANIEEVDSLAPPAGEKPAEGAPEPAPEAAPAQ